MCGLLLVCAEIGEAAARGRYSNFGPWPISHSRASGKSVTPRPHEHAAAKPLPCYDCSTSMINGRSAGSPALTTLIAKAARRFSLAVTCG
jgi:hypothetical protein